MTDSRAFSQVRTPEVSFHTKVLNPVCNLPVFRFRFRTGPERYLGKWEMGNNFPEALSRSVNTALTDLEKASRPGRPLKSSHLGSVPDLVLVVDDWASRPLTEGARLPIRAWEKLSLLSHWQVKAVKVQVRSHMSTACQRDSSLTRRLADSPSAHSRLVDPAAFEPVSRLRYRCANCRPITALSARRLRYRDKGPFGYESASKKGPLGVSDNRGAVILRASTDPASVLTRCPTGRMAGFRSGRPAPSSALQLRLSVSGCRVGFGQLGAERCTFLSHYNTKGYHMNEAQRLDQAWRSFLTVAQQVVGDLETQARELLASPPLGGTDVESQALMRQAVLDAAECYSRRRAVLDFVLPEIQRSTARSRLVAPSWGRS